MSLESFHGKGPGDLLGTLAMLDPDSIAEDLFKAYAKDNQGEVPVLRTTDAYLGAVISLRSHGLINANQTRLPVGAKVIATRLISIHRLTQEAAIRHLVSNNRIHQAFDNTVEFLRKSYPRQTNGESMYELFPECRRLTQHVTSLAGVHSQVVQASKGSLPESHSSHHNTTLQFFATLLADAGWFLYETGLADNALELFRKGEAICHDFFGGEPHALTALFYNNIGVVFDSQNLVEKATEYARNCLVIREACLSPDDPEMGNSYSNLGHNLLDQDRYADAREYYQKAVELHERAATPSDDLLEGAYSSLGFVCIFQDELEEADRWLQLAIIHGNKLKAPNHFTAITLSNLGMLRMKQRRWADARDVFRGCLASRKDVSGPTHRLVGSCLHQLAFVECMLDNNDEAIKLLREALPILRPTIRTHRGLLETSLLKLASCLDQVDGSLGGSAEAEELRREVLEVRKGDEKKESLRLDDERGWNDLVPISYRCLW